MEEVTVIKYKSTSGTMHDTKEACLREEFALEISKGAMIDMDDAYSVVDYLVRYSRKAGLTLARIKKSRNGD